MSAFRDTIFRPLGALAPEIFTRPTSPVNCISSRTWGAGRPHVGLCPIFLVRFNFAGWSGVLIQLDCWHWSVGDSESIWDSWLASWHHCCFFTCIFQVKIAIKANSIRNSIKADSANSYMILLCCLHSVVHVYNWDCGTCTCRPVRKLLSEVSSCLL